MDDAVKINFFGHSFFMITSAGGLRIAMDPYDEQVKSVLPEVRTDIALISHNHFDHNNISLFTEAPEIIIKTPGRHEVKGLKINGFSSFHDKSGGTARGKNIIFTFSIDGISFVHFGDLGTFPHDGILAELKGSHIIFIPVGGVYTINHSEAFELVKMIKPRIVVPMHFKEHDTKIGVDNISGFKSLASEEMEFKEFKKEFSIKKELLPENTEVWTVSSS